MNEFTNPLALTTPTIKGQKVKDAQWLLSGHNVFNTTKNPLHTLTGRLDGEYGPVTAGATREAKFELGYPTNKINTNFGPVVYGLLHGDLKLNASNLSERAKRLATPTKVKALGLAITQLGVKENPTRSNRTLYGAWYGMDGVFWCAIFISYCIEHVSNIDWKYSYVPTIVSDAAEGRNHMSLTYNPQPGDLVTYNWDGENCHVEFYEKDLGNGTFSAIGGNTGSNLPSSNGGEVCRSVRYHHQVSNFVRLNLP